MPESILALASLLIVLVIAYGGEGQANRVLVKSLTLATYALALVAVWLIGPQTAIILE